MTTTSFYIPVEHLFHDEVGGGRHYLVRSSFARRLRKKYASAAANDLGRWRDATMTVTVQWPDNRQRKLNKWEGTGVSLMLGLQDVGVIPLDTELVFRRGEPIPFKRPIEALITISITGDQLAEMVS